MLSRENSTQQLSKYRHFVKLFDTPLLRLSPKDHWSVRQAFEGVQIFGGTGSGKTSGSGRALAHAFLRAGWGGLVLCAKPEEAALWRAYAHECGRSSSLFMVDGQNGEAFNFLDYELARIDSGASTDNVVAVLLNIIEASKVGKGKRQQSESNFWIDACREFLSNAIDVLVCAYGRATLAEIFQLAQTTQRSDEQLLDEAWRAASFSFQTLKAAHEAPVRPLPAEDLAAIAGYFRWTFGTLDNKTRSNLMATLSSLVNPFLKGRLREIFCTHTSFVPEMTHEGAIIVMDLPIKQWEQAGIIAQHIVKYAWQRATERRAKSPEARPVFLWADESQFFTSSYDTEFQSTARSSRACTVYLTQSIEAYLHAQGGDEHAVYSLLTNFQTKIFHANHDPRTNTYAADLVGKWQQTRRNWSSGVNHSMNTGHSVSESQSWGNSRSSNNATNQVTTSSNSGGSSSESFNSGQSHGSSQSEGESEVIDYLLQPSFFASRLRRGGRESGLLVDGVVLHGGNLWSNGTPALLCEFSQA